MPIDVSQLVGAPLAPRAGSWDANDVILYHLGLNAGSDPVAPGELSYTYEAQLGVLPTFGVIPASPMLPEMLRLPGMDVDLAHILHGEQDLEIHEPLHATASVRTEAHVAEVVDKGRAALVVLETVTRDAADHRALFTNRFSAFIRGEGGFGGPASRATPVPPPPQREPDAEVRCPTLPQQALIYRLSGDLNPIHADPEFAARGGFERPILHGLCSYGIACKAVVDELLDGDVAAVARFRARFVGVVYPGETLTVRMWRTGDVIVLEAVCKDRGTPVLSGAAIELRPASDRLSDHRA